jgi:hypothetical protein
VDRIGLNMSKRQLKQLAVRESLNRKHTALSGNVTNADIERIVADKKARRELHERNKLAAK